MLHLLQGNLHTRPGQAAFLCDIYHMIMLKRETSCELGMSYFILEQENKYLVGDAYPNFFPPKITTCECLNSLEGMVTFLLTV